MIAVLEKRPRWMPELQRQFLHDSVLLRTFRSVEDLIDFSSQTVPQLVVIDLDIGMSQFLRLLAHGSQYAKATIAIGNSKTDVLEPSLRELGISAYHRLPLSGQVLAQECRLFL
jgi:hypothetical protein